MAIFYKLQFRPNVKHPELCGYHAAVSYKGMVTTDEVAGEIQRNCSMKRSDVLAVLAELSEVLKQQIQQSHSVKLDGIGIFRPGIRSTMVKNPKDFKAAANIKGLKLNFIGESFKQGRQRVKAVFAGARVMQEGVPSTTVTTPPDAHTDTGAEGEGGGL